MLKDKELGTQNQEQRPRKKKAKGPNPLSCKKKQKKATPSVGMKRPADSDPSEPVKKRRKRLKVAAHVRQELLPK